MKPCTALIADKFSDSTQYDACRFAMQDYMLPELRNDDWLIFPRMGAYTLCGASNFNGIHATDVPTFYVSSG